MSDALAGAGVGLVSGLAWLAFAHRTTFNRILWPVLGIFAVVWLGRWWVTGSRDWLLIGGVVSAFLLVLQRVSALAAEDAEKKVRELHHAETGKVEQSATRERSGDHE